SHTEDNILLSFADRPDSLFNKAHQKLNIIFLKRSEKSCKEWLFTSNYNYWYSKERNQLFNKVKIVRNDFTNEKFIPKIGTNIEKEVYSKVFANDSTLFQSSKELSLYNLLTSNDSE